MNIKKIKTITAGAAAIIKAKAFMKKFPLAVGWALTYHCNRHCLYCRLWDKKNAELTRKEVLTVIDDLKKMGTMMISFTGGEPLLRDDIEEIITHAHNQNIKVKLNSNGALVKEKIEALKNLDILYLSLEGPREVHDAIRGQGSWDEVMGAISAATNRGIRCAFYTVLTKHNCKHLDSVLAAAQSYHAKVYVQPVEKIALGSTYAHMLAPSTTQIHQAIDYLIEQKKKKNPSVGNSRAALKHLRLWPQASTLRCASGRLTCRIEPDGDMLNCSRKKIPAKPGNCIRDGVRAAFENLSETNCPNCWCASRIEINRILTADIQTALDYARSFLL
ncbi:MAG: radical SAM protein [Candidatus Omnitrophota bacterium]